MELQEFAQKVRNGVSKRLGEGYQVKINRVRKNNNVNLYGLIIQAKEQNVYPTIYLELFWNRYKEGMTLSEIVSRIIDIYRKDAPKQTMDFHFFEDFQQVKERICYRLIHKERNRELLEQIPYVPYLDLAICFYYSYESTCLGKGSILIYQNHMELWNTSVEELLQLAKENTPRLYPVWTNSMETVIRRLMNEHTQQEYEIPDDMPMLVLSNRSCCYGAITILYSEVMEGLAQSWQESFYILPSSVHEVILLRDNGQENPERLQAMIQEINQSEVDPTEILSDSLYHYDRTDKLIRRIL